MMERGNADRADRWLSNHLSELPSRRLTDYARRTAAPRT